MPIFQPLYEVKLKASKFKNYQRYAYQFFKNFEEEKCLRKKLLNSWIEIVEEGVPGAMSFLESIQSNLQILFDCDTLIHQL
jgi:hypothetical protein